MPEDWFSKLLLSPLSLLYGMGVSLRNMFYDTGLLKSAKFNLPVISVGNLSLGGAGKTPHIEYLIRLLKDYIHVGTLSRGYKRKTKGFRIVQHNDNALNVGDEPLQYRLKYPEITVAVSESRTIGIPKMLSLNPHLQTILLDDAFQHRSVTPGLNILLTQHNNPYSKDYLLPSGRLREWRSAADRADVVIVSKCPVLEEEVQREKLTQELNLKPHQKLFFSYYQYRHPYYLLNPSSRIPLREDMEIILLSAIANTSYMVDYVLDRVESIIPMQYEDHHYFSNHDISQLKLTFDQIENPNKIILTTEKDATRLFLHRNYILKEKLPILILPAEVKFHFGQAEYFNQLVRDFLLNFKV